MHPPRCYRCGEGRAADAGAKPTYRPVNSVDIFVKVPSSVATPFRSLSDADQRFDATIKDNYCPLVLIAQTFCPDTEGPIWAK